MMERLNKHKIIYFERPVTADEKEIAALLEILIGAIGDNNFEKLKSVFSPVASIFLSSADRNSIGVAECVKRLKKFTGDIRNINYENALIRVRGYQATISAVRVVFRKGEVPHRAPRYFKCQKENGRWEIIEADFA